MRVKVIESFSTVKGKIPTDAIIDIPEKLLESLQGKVEPLPFAKTQWQAEIIKLADERSSKDPGGDCWQWIKENRPQLWRDHLVADMAIDQACQEQSAEKIGEAISRVRETFTAMIESWNNRHNKTAVIAA